MGKFLTGTDRSKGLLRVDEVDGSPAVYGVNRITVTNGTLTDNGGGHVTITIGGGGISFNGSTADGVVTYGNATTADVEPNLTFDGSTLAVKGNITTTSSVAATTTVTAGTTISATETVTGGTGLIATTGGVTATAGGVTATAGDITATVGDIIATAGDITATAGGITATAGNVTATAGNIIATAGGITATAGDITATAGGITATAGNITATAANVTAGDTVQGVTLTDSVAKIVEGTMSNMAFGLLEQTITALDAFPNPPATISDDTARFLILTSTDGFAVIDIAGLTPDSDGCFLIVYMISGSGTIDDTGGGMSEPIAERQAILFLKLKAAGWFKVGSWA